MPLIREQLIDFIRVHVSAIGGLTPARKLAVLCESFGVRTAWHGPGDVSPVGHAANLHLDLSSWNFGIQEWYGPSDVIREVFPGCPEVRGGYAYVNDKPGLGIDIDEKKAAKYPCRNELPAWTLARRPDGTAARP
jgi:mannonate dehydratase